jgi:hypothetical protein
MDPYELAARKRRDRCGLLLQRAPSRPPSGSAGVLRVPKGALLDDGLMLETVAVSVVGRWPQGSAARHVSECSGRAPSHDNK